MSKAFQNILVVVKQTPYETYRQMQKLGTAPIALRWERLKNRYEAHRRCVDTVTGILDRSNVSYSVTKREELHRGSVVGKDLVIAVGGDGTVLNTSSFIDDTIPVLGVNSDPTLAHEKGVHKLKDERRSTGALCAATANDVLNILPEILLGNIAPGLRARMQCLVRSAYTETRLPPALNDILVSNPIPAAISRFRLSLVNENVVPSYQSNANYQEVCEQSLRCNNIGTMNKLYS